MPQQFPPKPGTQQKGKGGKQNAANSGKYDDRSNKMNKRDLMKKGYLVDDRISYDEEGEERYLPEKFLFLHISNVMLKSPLMREPLLLP